MCLEAQTCLPPFLLLFPLWWDRLWASFLHTGNTKKLWIYEEHLLWTRWQGSSAAAWQLKHLATSRFITRLCRSPGSPVTDPVEISNTFAQFYTNLYKSDAPSDKNLMNKFLDNLEFPVIDDTTRNSLNTPVRRSYSHSQINAEWSPCPSIVGYVQWLPSAIFNSSFSLTHSKT